MTRGKTIIAGMTIFMLMAMLVALSFIAPIFAQGVAAQTGGNENSGAEADTTDNTEENAGTVVFEEVAYFGLEEAIAQAEADGIISAEQAAQLQAMLDEFNASLDGPLVLPGGTFEFNGEGGGIAEGGAMTVTALEEIAIGPGEHDDHLAAVLQRAVENGLLSQEEADQLLADLEAGTLTFLLVSDEGVFTDPADVPESLQDLLPEEIDPNSTVILIHMTTGGIEQTDVDIFSGGLTGPGGLLDRFIPGRAADPDSFAHHVVFAPDILADAVAEGIISAEQADQMRSMIQLEVDVVHDARIVIGDESMPDAFLLEALTTRLQQAVEDEAVTQAEVDSLMARLQEILE